MSILIKGMEMPEGCIICMFKSESLFNRTMWCEWLDDPLGDYSKCDEEWRHPDCPLVEVPTPHGRLIDAEKLERDIEEYHLSDGKFRHWVQVQNSIIEAEEGEDHD